MTEKSATQAFPRRDADGRVFSLREFAVASLLGTGVALIALALIDAVLALVGLGTFGAASGWLAVILPALLFFDDLRAWRGHAVRLLVAVVAGGLGIGLGLIVAALAHGLPPILSGGLGAVTAAVVYCPVWFLGVRWVTGHHA